MNKSLISLIAIPLFLASACGDKNSVPSVKQVSVNYSLAKEWKRHCNSYEAIPESEVFDRSRRGTRVKEPSLIGFRYGDFTRDSLLDLAQTTCYNTERTVKALAQISRLGLSKSSDDLVKLALDNTTSALENPDFNNFLRQEFEREVDCRAISATLASNYIYLLSNNNLEGEVSLVTGLYFGKEAPNGDGHCWNVIDGKIVDHALKLGIREPSNDQIYVPITTMVLQFKDNHINGSLKANCLPGNKSEEDKK